MQEVEKRRRLGAEACKEYVHGSWSLVIKLGDFENFI